MRIAKIVAPAGRLAACGTVVLALCGCSMGNMFGAAPAASTTQQLASASPTEIAAAAPGALPAIATECPPIRVRPGGEALFSYGGGQVGNPNDLHYQAVIDQSSRNCVVSNGLITVQMGVVGRVLLGPKGNEQSVNVPVRFAVERDGMAVFSEKYVLPVSLAPPAQTAEFVKVLENVAIPYVGGETIVIWVGFDPRG